MENPREMGEKSKHGPGRLEAKRRRLGESDEVGGNREVMGHIALVHLKDFMVHEDFEWRPGHNVNIITGKNGSGKSSVLQGIVLGLMYGSRQVGRYARIGDFVRRGAMQAVIEVTLHNTGEEQYKPEQFGEQITFRRVIYSSGKRSSTLELLREGGGVVYGRDKGSQEGSRVLEWFNIQLENPLTVLQQDYAKDMLRVEKPGKLYGFFESATMLKQCREEYKKSEVELIQVDKNLVKIKQGISELQNEANTNKDIVTEGIKLKERDERFEHLKRQKVWAKVKRKTREIEDKEFDLKELNTKQEGIEVKVKRFEKEVFERKEEKQVLIDQDQYNLKVEQDHRFKVAELKDDNKVNLTKKMTSSKKMKTLQWRVEVLKNQIMALEETMLMVKTTPSRARVNIVKDLENQMRTLKELKEAADLERIEFDVEITAVSKDCRTKEFEVKGQEQVISRLQQERKELEGKTRNKQDDRGIKIDECIRSRRGDFRRQPIGPVGRHVRVDGDANLVDLVEAELIPKMLWAYLVHDDHDRRLMASILDKYYGGTEKRPMIFTSKFLPEKHAVKRLQLIGSSRDLLDVLQLRGSEIEQTVVFNFLVDQRSVESVAISKTQVTAAQLCTHITDVPRGLTNCITLDWYRFNPPTLGSSYRSYYINKRQSTFLTSSLWPARLQQKQGEIEKAGGMMQDMLSEGDIFKQKLKELEKVKFGQISKLDRIRKDLLETGTELRKEQQQMNIDLEGYAKTEEELAKNRDEVLNLEGKINAKIEEIDQLEAILEKGKEMLSLEKDNLTKMSDRTYPMKLRLERIQSKIKLKEIQKKTEEQKLAEVMNRKMCLNQKFVKNKVELSVLMAEAKSVTDDEEIDVEESVEMIQAKINEIMKERLTRTEAGADYSTQALYRYRELSEKIDIKIKKIESLKSVYKELKEQQFKRQEVFHVIRSKMARMVEHRFQLLAKQTMASLHIRLEVDFINREIRFIFGEETFASPRSDLSSLSGGEKSYSQLCLILALWHFMAAPFRCLDEWDVFLDSVNRAEIGAELVRYAGGQQGSYQFVFISPQVCTVLCSTPLHSTVLIPLYRERSLLPRTRAPGSRSSRWGRRRSDMTECLESV
jgi:chromosome segregation ATPase